jgi:hypothetical protein
MLGSCWVREASGEAFEQVEDTLALAWLEGLKKVGVEALEQLDAGDQRRVRGERDPAGPRVVGIARAHHDAAGLEPSERSGYGRRADPKPAGELTLPNPLGRAHDLADQPELGPGQPDRRELTTQTGVEQDLQRPEPDDHEILQTTLDRRSYVLHG